MAKVVMGALRGGDVVGCGVSDGARDGFGAYGRLGILAVRVIPFSRCTIYRVIQCPIFVEGLSKVCPNLQNVLLLSNIFQISGQMYKVYINFVQDLFNIYTFVQTFLALAEN